MSWFFFNAIWAWWCVIQLSLCVFLPATVVKRWCRKPQPVFAHVKNISRASGQKFFLFFSLFGVNVRQHLGREVGQRVREGGRVLSPSLSALILILLFQSRGCVCSVGRCVWQRWTLVADRRHGTDSSNWYWCMCVCVCVYPCVCMCVCFSVLCSTDLFSGSRVYMHGHGSRTGLVWCWSRTLSPSSSTTNPLHPTWALTQTHWFRHTLHTQHALTLDYHTYHCTLVLPWRSEIICVHAHSWCDQAEQGRTSCQWSEEKSQNESFYLFSFSSKTLDSYFKMWKTVYTLNIKAILISLNRHKCLSQQLYNDVNKMLLLLNCLVD